MISGIYVIRNTLNDKVYIGKSVDYEKRIYEHKRRLINNNHDNIYLQRSWNKYGEDAFNFSLIEECEEEYLNDREILYIKMFESNTINKGYNLTAGGDGATGYRHTEETKKKLSEMQIGKKLPLRTIERISLAHKGKTPKNINILIERNKAISKNIIQINCNDESVKLWESIQECARNLNIHATNIVKCLKGTYKTCSGNIFMYEEEFDQNDMNIANLITERSEKKRTVKGIVKLTLDFEFVESYDSMKELESEGFVRQYLRLCCINKKDSYKGFKWMYKKDYDNYILN